MRRLRRTVIHPVPAHFTKSCACAPRPAGVNADNLAGRSTAMACVPEYSACSIAATCCAPHRCFRQSQFFAQCGRACPRDPSWECHAERMRRVGVILSRWGSWPAWTPLLMHTLRANAKVEFLLVTDVRPAGTLPPNVAVHNVSLDGLLARARAPVGSRLVWTANVDGLASILLATSTRAPAIASAGSEAPRPPARRRTAPCTSPRRPYSTAGQGAGVESAGGRTSLLPRTARPSRLTAAPSMRKTKSSPPGACGPNNQTARRKKS